MGEARLPSARADTCDGVLSPQLYNVLFQDPSRGKYGLAIPVLRQIYAGRGMLPGI